MKIGTPKEVLKGENRVAMTPDSALQLQKLGYDCAIETGAGDNAGFKDADFAKPIITVAVTYTNATPCNHHIREMGDIVVKQIEELGGKAFVFGTPVVSDGETTGIKVSCESLQRLLPICRR